MLIIHFIQLKSRYLIEIFMVEIKPSDVCSKHFIRKFDFDFRL